MSKRDRHLISKIENTKFLKDQTKSLYLRKIQLVQNDIWPGASLSTILKNPEIFKQKLEGFCLKTKGRLGENCGDHYKDGIFSAIMAIFTYNDTLKENYAILFEKWKDVQRTVREPIEQKYKSNKPTVRQEQAYIQFDKLVEIRDRLPHGSQEQLLLSMYTHIPPARSDYHKTRIYTKKPHQDTEGNYIVLNNNPTLVLQDFKTAKIYKKIEIQLPPELVNDIQKSLDIFPRKYLFVSPRTNTPFDIPSSFNTWANRILKNITGKKEFTLSMLRHIYITRRDLKLEEKSGLEQDEIARAMGHSISTQRRYMWHTYEKDIVE